MASSTKNDFITRPNYPPGQVVTWVGHTVQFEMNCEITNKSKNTDQRNICVLGTLDGENESSKNFNGII